MTHVGFSGPLIYLTSNRPESGQQSKADSSCPDWLVLASGASAPYSASHKSVCRQAANVAVAHFKVSISWRTLSFMQQKLSMAWFSTATIKVGMKHPDPYLNALVILDETFSLV